MLFDVIIIIRKKKNECAAAEAPTFAASRAKLGLVRPDRFEPRAGQQLQAVKFIREKLFDWKLGKFLDEAKRDLKHWQEPEASEVPEDVWTAIRRAGFGSAVKNRDLTRVWQRRASIRKKVELLELGKAGGVFKKAVRHPGKSRRQCSGQGSRTMVVLEPAPKRRRVEGEEGIEEGEESDEEQGELVAVKKGKQSLLKEVFEQVKSTFEDWRLGGLYVDPAVFLSIT